jgi:hypothetical protein
MTGNMEMVLAKKKEGRRKGRFWEKTGHLGVENSGKTPRKRNLSVGNTGKKLVSQMCMTQKF